MSRERGRVLPLEQRCIEPGHWLIEGRHVRAVYEGRGRKIMSWTVGRFDDDREAPPASGFLYLADAREWIAGQNERST
jgi:hypothetical protein